MLEVGDDDSGNNILTLLNLEIYFYFCKIGSEFKKTTTTSKVKGVCVHTWQGPP